ncbi:asparagine synthase (glutamine-hydrolyzing) [Carboxydothermus ferrireducens]|uniref:asparagine synthase (glutamine-hydrolyzing) n=1 Tax=Carboxydothermus ferrireducens DSM 11255 TaxID=1119529 RepID=A0ABX2RBH7_9THEO|nr:asparagine synthase (glutamine-hydrolyzing) [Carboxydothermus ferrireducens]NYE57476.1 asparagine synthase (glutamine-hydrolyzing) [Carboxydothermus ferrireducens DSM 11255]
MCGIAGMISFSKDLSPFVPLLEKMTQSLTHRGPDALGIWHSENIILGHRRLTVIDPERGRQPMIRTYGDLQYVIVYNGELYNTKELRDELETRGHHFYTTCDTEVLLVSYIEWGKECLSKLNGIFAFAIFDEKENQLFLARDRLGVKPLFYALVNDTLIFASEIKALLLHPDIPSRLSTDGLKEVLFLGPARTPGMGVFAHISELLPGDYAVFNPEGLFIKPYWRLTSNPHPDDFPTTVKKTRELLEDAVIRQLVSDVPICTLLSGGLDSTVITAFAARHLHSRGETLNTFSVDYAENELYFTESAFQPNCDAMFIPLVAKEFNTLHRNIVLTQEELFDALFPALTARDLPGMVDIDSSLWLFSREIKKEATVGLSGECADEIFGGYPWFFRKEALEAKTFPWALSLDRRKTLFRQDLIAELKPDEYVQKRYHEALEEIPEISGLSPEEKRLREITYLTLTRWMPILLDRKDRMTMAWGLEVRVPYCDHRLVEYLWNVPWHFKTAGGQEKGLLRQAVADLIPDYILKRKKSPYPKTHHPLYTKLVREALTQILAENSSPINFLIDENEVRKLITNPSPPNARPWFGQLMGDTQIMAYLIQLNYWFKKYHISF